MKLVQYRMKEGNRSPNTARDREGTAARGEEAALRLGAVNRNGEVIPLSFSGTMRQLIEKVSHTPEYKRQIEIEAEELTSSLPMSQVTLCSPLTDPEKLIFVGLNYADHARESGMDIPAKPVLFAKYNNSIAGPEEDIWIPDEVSQCDYEVELAVIIGRTARNIAEEQAVEHIFGYTIINDVSARDIQLSEGQWTRGKAIDGFAPMGPWLVTADSLRHPEELSISLKLNGTTMQSSNTRELIFNIPYLVSFLSRTMTLKPGDVISTGTPPGVGMGMTPPVWLQDGDVTEAEIQGIGILRNTFKRGCQCPEHK